VEEPDAPPGALHAQALSNAAVRALGSQDGRAQARTASLRNEAPPAAPDILVRDVAPAGTAIPDRPFGIPHHCDNLAFRLLTECRSAVRRAYRNVEQRPKEIFGWLVTNSSSNVGLAAVKARGNRQDLGRESLWGSPRDSARNHAMRCSR